jgi:pimeloyl-ACP methyl ester carboxylesterase
MERLNGIRMYFEVHGSGEPVLLLHGYTGCSQDWAGVVEQWKGRFQLIIPDLRGHGRSEMLTGAFRHEDASADVLALLDHLGVHSANAVGVSGGGNVLLHIGSAQPHRIGKMVLVSATPYFPEQARSIMRQYGGAVTDEQFEALRRKHLGGDEQIRALLAGAGAFADSYDDMNFTPPRLSRIQARTLVVQGDRDPLYPVELSVEMFRAIPNSSLWIVPRGGHGPVLGEHWPEFVRTAGEFIGDNADR